MDVFLFLSITIFLTSFYIFSIVCSAILFGVKVDQVSFGLGRRIFGIQIKHIQFNVGILPVGGGCSFADYSSFPGLSPFPDELRTKQFLPRLLIEVSGIFALLCISVLLLGFEKLGIAFVASIKSFIGYFLFQKSLPAVFKPFDWFTFTGFYALIYALGNLFPVAGVSSGDRIISLILHRFATNSFLAISRYQKISLKVTYFLMAIAFIHFAIELFS